MLKITMMRIETERSEEFPRKIQTLATYMRQIAVTSYS